jgi:hypothetical protein
VVSTQSSGSYNLTSNLIVPLFSKGDIVVEEVV